MGQDSGIADATTDVFLEVAFFVPDAIAGRGRRYGLMTDASQRFERGVDPQLQERAIERATELLLGIAGGHAGPLVVMRATGTERQGRANTAKTQRVEHVLGVRSASSMHCRQPERLGMTLRAAGDRSGTYVLLLAFRRSIEEDLIEEIVRIHGYDKVRSLPMPDRPDLSPWTETRLRPERVADLLAAMRLPGSHQYAFTDAARRRCCVPSEPGLALSNPISAELAVMRVSLVARSSAGAAGKSASPATPRSIVRAGPEVRQWNRYRNGSDRRAWPLACPCLISGAHGRRPMDFYDVKADVEALLHAHRRIRGIPLPEQRAIPPCIPVSAARIYHGEMFRSAGSGQSIPRSYVPSDLTYPAVIFELNVDIALRATRSRGGRDFKIPRHPPGSGRDRHEAVSSEALRTSVAQSAGTLLRNVTVFDVYRGHRIA